MHDSEPMPPNLSLKALELRKQTEVTSISRDAIYHGLQLCINQKDLASGRHLYYLMVIGGLDVIRVLGDHVIRMFATCGSLIDAEDVFCRVVEPSLYTWNTIISAHAMFGKWCTVFEIYDRMQENGIAPDRITYLCMLKVCANIVALEKGRHVFSQIVKWKLDSEVVTGNTVIYMFTKCKKLEDAQKVFDSLPFRDSVSYNVMISAYAELGDGLLALELLEIMQQNDIKPDRVAYLSILKVSTNTDFLKQGKLIHDHIIKSGLDTDITIGNTLVDMYAKSDNLDEACKLFETLPDHDVVSWGVIIAGYVQNGDSSHALRLYSRMEEKSILPSRVTFMCTLKACGNVGSIHQGRLIHDQLVRDSFEEDALVGSTLVDMYARCGSLIEAETMFEDLTDRDIVSWGAMIAGYTQHGYGYLALESFEKMQQEGVKPNEVLLLCCLKACASVGARLQGRMLHDMVLRYGLDSEVLVGNSIVNMYVKFENLKEASRVLFCLPFRDVVTWSTIIAGYAGHGHCFMVLELYIEMRRDGLIPDRVTFLCLVKSCGSLGAIEQGRILHGEIIVCDLYLDATVGNSLIDMYSKCGSMADAHSVCSKMTSQDGVSCAAMVSGYAQCGLLNSARECFEDMQQRGLKPTDAVFLGILAACSHAGLLNEGCYFLECMEKVHGLAPNIQHYSCMVDLLGRAGHLVEAEDLLKTMPLTPNGLSLTSLLTNCKTFIHDQLGVEIFNQVAQTDPFDVA